MAKDLSVQPDLKVLVIESDHTMVIVSPASIMLRCTRCGGVKYLHDYGSGPVGVVRSCACNESAQSALPIFDPLHDPLQSAGERLPESVSKAFPYGAVINTRTKYNPGG